MIFLLSQFLSSIPVFASSLLGFNLTPEDKFLIQLQTQNAIAKLWESLWDVKQGRFNLFVINPLKIRIELDLAAEFFEPEPDLALKI